MHAELAALATTPHQMPPRTNRRFPAPKTTILAAFGLALSCRPATEPTGGIDLPLGDVSLACRQPGPARLLTPSLWIPTDSAAPEVRIVVQPTAGTSSAACSVRIRTFGDDDVVEIAAAGQLGADTFRIALRPKTEGRGTLDVSLNGRMIGRVNLLVASRAFARVAIGHRGAGALWPENTLLAMRIAASARLAAGEMDVRLTRDSVPVLMHDVTVDRTTNGTGPVQDYTLAELQQLDAAGYWHSSLAGEVVPTLESVLAETAMTGLPLVLDVKRDQTVVPDSVEAAIIVGLLRRYRAEDRVTLLSTSARFMRAARQLSSAVGITLFDWGYRPEYRVFMRSLGGRVFLMHHADSLLLSRMRPVYDSLAADRIGVLSSTANRPSQIDSLLALVPVAGIVTDFPPRAYMQLSPYPPRIPK